MECPPDNSRGCVYVAFDLTKPDRCKIGFSSREAAFRIAEASNPDYKFFGKVKSPQAKAVERIAHKVMEAAGVQRLSHASGGRSEWFSVSAKEALRVVKCVAHAALAIPLKPLLPELCRALVYEGLNEQMFLVAQCRVVRAAQRRKRTLFYVMQIAGGEAREQYPINVWLNSAGEQSLRKELTALLQEYRKHVPVQRRNEWHELHELLPLDPDSRQKKNEADSARASQRAQMERVCDIISWSEDVLAVLHDKQLADVISQLALLRANNGPLDKGVQEHAEKTWIWVQAQYQGILLQFEERKKAALGEADRRAEQAAQYAKMDSMRKENAELANDLKPWVDMTCKRIGIINNLAWEHCPLLFTEALDAFDRKQQLAETPEKRAMLIAEFLTQWRTA